MLAEGWKDEELVAGLGCACDCARGREFEGDGRAKVLNVDE